MCLRNRTYLRDEERPRFWSFFYLLFPSLSLLSLHLMKPPPPKCMLGAGQKEPLQPKTQTLCLSSDFQGLLFL